MGTFVGRSEELRVLAGIAAAPLAGDVAAVVLVGDPGSGKSRLLAEARQGLRVPNQFEIVGYEPESSVPLAAASDFLRSLAGAGSRGRELEVLLFSAGGPAEYPLEPLRVFEATHRALDRLGSTVVLVDDLQWVDGLSIALCHYLLRAATSGGGLAIVAAGRPSEAATSLTSSLEQVLADRLRYLELGPLSNAEALELARALVPGLDEDAARKLSEKSAGSPFWLQALARPGGSEPDAARLVSARLRGASMDAGELFALLAVAGRPLALVDAATVQGWEAARNRLRGSSSRAESSPRRRGRLASSTTSSGRWRWPRFRPSAGATFTGGWASGLRETRREVSFGFVRRSATCTLRACRASTSRWSLHARRSGHSWATKGSASWWRSPTRPLRKTRQSPS
jgi:hypothetical protein